MVLLCRNDIIPMACLRLYITQFRLISQWQRSQCWSWFICHTVLFDVVMTSYSRLVLVYMSYNFVVNIVYFVADAASRAGVADSSQAAGLMQSGFQGFTGVNRGTPMSVPRKQCISSFVLRIQFKCLEVSFYCWHNRGIGFEWRSIHVHGQSVASGGSRTVLFSIWLVTTLNKEKFSSTL